MRLDVVVDGLTAEDLAKIKSARNAAARNLGSVTDLPLGEPFEEECSPYREVGLKRALRPGYITLLDVGALPRPGEAALTGQRRVYNPLVYIMSIW